jgi:predicted TIM-barrel fold metal-dependent hydrolase
MKLAIRNRNHVLVALVAFAVLSIAMPAPAAADAALPVVDLHAHAFNLRYLPVRGVLVARGVPKAVAEVLDRLLVAATPLADLDGGSADALMDAELPAIPAMSDAEARSFVLGRIQAASARADRRELLDADERRALRKYAADVLARRDLPPGEAGDAALIDAALEKAPLGPTADRSYPRFLAMLMQDELAIVRRLGREYPKVDLFVHHLMDMENPYDDRPSLPNAGQIARLEPLGRRFPGSLAAFVAFDPFRRDDALATVRAAVETGRAVGVKFYPPSGYRAAGNAFEPWPPKPAFWKLALRSQWKSRYGGWRGRDLDAVNRELFAWAAANDVPILAHCTPGGFEAFTGSGRMSDPEHWRRVLVDFPRLRLALAHAGGGESWFADHGPDPDTDWDGARDFDQRAWDLATRHENVYLDLSYSDEVLDPAKRDVLRRRLKALLAASADRPFALGDKLVYGSDWHMVGVLDRRTEIFAELERLFTEPALAPWKERFFAANAVRYLRLADYAGRAPLDPAGRAALAAFAARAARAGAAPSR